MQHNHFEHSYFQLCRSVLQHGEVRPSRVGPTTSLFGTMLPIMDLTIGEFPILSTRKMFVKGIVGELAAFLQGATELSEYKALGCNYWDANAAAWSFNMNTDPKYHIVGNIYGAQWRKFGKHGVDQLEMLIKGLRDDPFGRRHLLTTYDPSTLFEACLPPCHLLAQFYVRQGTLDCMVTMRSVDVCLGLPTDVVLYAVLLLLVAQTVGLKPGRLAFSMGDTHIYHKHTEQVMEQLARSIGYTTSWTLDERATINNFTPSMFSLVDYNPQEAIPYELLA